MILVVTGFTLCSIRTLSIFISHKEYEETGEEVNYVEPSDYKSMFWLPVAYFLTVILTTIILRKILM